MAKKTGKPRNPKAQDGTLINIDALKKRVAVLEKGFVALEKRLRGMELLLRR